MLLMIHLYHVYTYSVSEICQGGGAKLGLEIITGVVVLCMLGVSGDVPQEFWTSESTSGAFSNLYNYLPKDTAIV